MTTTTALGKTVYLLTADKVTIDDVGTYFVIAHGVQQKSLITVSGFELYFPWGINNFGWYESDTGFPLADIYRNYRLGRSQGLPASTRFAADTQPTPSSLAEGLTTPLLAKQINRVPEIALDPQDLNLEFCERMLTTYYTASPYAEAIGILCLSGKSTLGEVMTFFSLALKKSDNVSDVLVISLCCSVKRGEEASAMARAAGYVQIS